MNKDNLILEAMLSRRSIRKFTGEPVSRADILTILEAGRWAPSGLNNQPWRFLVIRSEDQPESKQALAGCTKYAHVVNACDCLILVFLDKKAMYSEMKDHQGAGACIQNMLLAVHALGLGAVWLGEIINQSAQVLDALALSADEYEFQAALAVGHPDQKGSSNRKPLDELLIKEF